MTKEEALNDWLPIIRQMVKGTEVYTEALDMAIKALEQQPTDAVVDRVTIKEYLYNLGMGIKVTATDAVDRQAALEVIRKCHCEEWVKADIGAPIEALPSVSPQPKMGQWKRINKEKYVQHAMSYYRCSECDKEIIGTHNYCPNCGAKMSEIPTDSEGSDIDWDEYNWLKTEKEEEE